MPTFVALSTAFIISFCGSALAWGPEGHRTVGALAESLIAGSPAERQVKALLGDWRLRDVAVWADCVKGIDPAQGYAYVSRRRYAECSIFETEAGEAEMADFVRRNDANCGRRSSAESCHKQYHYTDAGIERERYARGLAGTRDDDVVAAVSAALAVLKGRPSPAPFAIKGEREALLLLAHHVGDLHQPLHVGAIRLDAEGHRVDADAHGRDRAFETRGGNAIITFDAVTQAKGANLHAVWDAVPLALTASHVDADWLSEARAVPVTPGDAAIWPAAWASETLGQSRKAFAGLRFGPRDAGVWPVELPPTYGESMAAIKRTQLTRAGARLAQLLQSVWH